MVFAHIQFLHGVRNVQPGHSRTSDPIYTVDTLSLESISNSMKHHTVEKNNDNNIYQARIYQLLVHYKRKKGD